MKDVFKGWIVLNVGDQNLSHAIPVQDLSPHYRVDCPCEPIIEEIYGGIEVIMHNAFDGRGEVKH